MSGPTYNEVRAALCEAIDAVAKAKYALMVYSGQPIPVDQAPAISAIGRAHVDAQEAFSKLRCPGRTGATY